MANVDIGGNTWGITRSLNSVAYTLSLAGFDANGAAPNLFTKNGGAGEMGVGLVGTFDHELTLADNGNRIANFIRYNVSSVDQAFPGSVGPILTGSTPTAENLDVWGSNTAT